MLADFHRDPSIPSPIKRSQKMRVAILDEELPYPPNTGKRIRTLNLITELARRQELTYLCYRSHDPDEIAPAKAHMAGLGINVEMHNEPPPKQTVLVNRCLLYAKLAKNMLSPHPYLVDTHVRGGFVKMVRRFQECNQTDLWLCEWTPYAQVMRHLKPAPWVVVAHNVESLIWQRYHEMEQSPFKRWYIKTQWKKFQAFERWAFSQATRLITVSEQDAELARSEYGARRISIVDNGVDANFFSPNGTQRSSRQILFLGSLDWRPNLDGVTLLLDTIFPEVRRTIADAELLIVGRKPPEWLRQQMARQPGVKLLADVPDVRPYLRAATVMAVPLRIGGGSRLKILEALACETPVVSTRIGAEGLRVVDGEHLAIVESPEQMAARLVDDLTDPKAAQSWSQAGSELVRRHYDWSILGDRLEAALFEARNSGPHI